MNFQKVVATCFYIGKLPIAPGTWGSVLTLSIWMLIPLDYFIQFALILILFIIGLLSSSSVANQLNDNDPSEIIIDEVVGMAIAIYMLPKSISLYFISFCLFRFFDIFKPSFIYHSQKLPNGWGIMMDDILAGILSWLLVNGMLSIL